MVPNLFACIITPNFFSKNVTLLYTEVCFYEIVLYFWIFNFQTFHVSNIKSRWNRIDITASDSGNFWSAYFSSFSLVSSNFLSFPRPCNFSFLSNWQKMHLSFSYTGSAKRDNRLFFRKVAWLFDPDFWFFGFINPSPQGIWIWYDMNFALKWFFL